MNRESSISIKNQLQLYFVLALGFIVLLMGGVWISYDQVLHEREAERVLTVESEIIGAAVKPALMFNDRQLAGEMLQSMQFDKDISVVTLFTADGKTLYNYRAKGDHADSTGPVTFQNSNSSAYGGGKLSLYRVVMHKGRPVGVIYLKSVLNHMQENRFAGIMTVVLTMLGCLVVGLVLASRLQHKIAEPISGLAKLMRQMSIDGDYSLRTTSPAFNRETKELLVGFDQMAAEIEHSFAEAEEHHNHLHQSEERFRTIVELAPVPVIITRPSDGHLLFYNQAALNLFGVVVEGNDPFNASDFYQHPEQRQRLMQTLETEGEIHGYELEVVGVNGKPFWISLSMNVMRFEGEPALFSAFVDITEQKNVEQVLEKNNQLLEQRVVKRTAALQEARDELQSTLDNMIDTYYRVRADGSVERASASVFSLLGYQPSEIAGISLQALSVDGQPFSQLADALRQHDGAVINEKIQLKHKAGHAIWASISARVMKDEQGKVTGVEGVLRDISQLVQADLQKQEMENKMTHVQRLESLGILAGGIAHDFKQFGYIREIACR
ncbi:PAS domain S-box protein [Mariprofundus ferrooxydans]|uniref:PAS domain S-box protein n=1 Tax=Mariprofundus ferrooxydans TaxID=314344 RepID=UPI00037B1252|nr:PAS domain S-box protein [Mariprofundus ferrooxydans]